MIIFATVVYLQSEMHVTHGPVFRAMVVTSVSWMTRARMGTSVYVTTVTQVSCFTSHSFQQQFQLLQLAAQ